MLTGKARTLAALRIMLLPSLVFAGTAASALIASAVFAWRWQLGLAVGGLCSVVGFGVAWHRAGQLTAKADASPREDLVSPLADRAATGREMAHQLLNDRTTSWATATNWCRETVEWLREQGLHGRAAVLAPNVEALYRDTTGSTWQRDDAIRRRAAQVIGEIVQHLDDERRCIERHVVARS